MTTPVIQCIASTKDLSIPGRIRCSNSKSKKRNDSLCATHGRWADKGNTPVHVAIDNAPTLTEIYEHYSKLSLEEKRAAMSRSANEFPNLGMSDHQICSWLMAWYNTHPDAEPTSNSSDIV